MPKYKVSRTEILSADEVKKMIGMAITPKKKAMVAFLYLFGCRPAEMFHVRRDDMWIENDRLWVKILTKKSRRKAGSHLITQAHRTLSFVLNEFTVYIIEYAKTMEYGEPIFRYGWTENSHNVILDRSLKALDLNCCAYLFRHTRNTMLAEAGVSEAQAVAWNGWADSRPWLRNYVHRSKKLIEDIKFNEDAHKSI